MHVGIATGLVEEILGLAAADPEREVCGILLGSDRGIVGYRAADNVAPDPATAFEIDPAILFAVHRRARQGGATMVGCYHSHPNGDPTPSIRDREGATPGQYWLIVGGARARLYHAGESGEFTSCVMAPA